ncbi:MAG: DHH family phosphoesterase, partial [Candidatus Bathyarchaeia archaeon]
EVLERYAANGEFIRIITHIDADGIAASSIIAKALHSIGAMFRIRAVKQVDKQVIEELNGEGHSPVVFLDLGSGSLELLSVLNTKDVFVFDHHQPAGFMFQNLHHINPHIVGIDGSRELSGSGTAYLVAKALQSATPDLGCLAVVGALGDAQDKFNGRSLGGLNRILAEEVVELGHLIVEKKDLLLFGRETRPIHRAIAYTMNPYIPGLSGEEDRCLAFLAELGIDVKQKDRWRAINDLTEEEKQLLFSGLAKHMALNGLPDKASLSLLGTAYTLTQEERGTPLRDAREYASLLNACGRRGRPGLGVTIGFGSRGNILDEEVRVYGEYRKTLSEYLKWLEQHPDRIKKLSSIYVVDGLGVIDELMLSVVTSILLSSGRLNESKPVVALTSAGEGMTKFSGRLPEELKASLDLGSIFYEASRLYDGVGGGHSVAAGATIPSGRETEFTHFVDEKVGALLKQF